MASGTRLASDVALRGLAIASVVFNHAAAMPGRPFELGGGMNILVILSGYSFARFALGQGEPAAVRSAITRFVLGLALPTLAVILLAFVVVRYFDISELLFYNNFTEHSRAKILYTWYPQALVQISLLIYLLSFIPGLTRAFPRHGLHLSILATVAAFLIYLVLRDWQPGGIPNRLPTFILWMFTLGWLIYYADKTRTMRAEAVRWAILFLALGFAAIQYDQKELQRIIFTVITVIAMLWTRNWYLPSWIARLLTLASQAAFTTFLLHMSFLRVFDALKLRPHKTGFHPLEITEAWAFALAGSVMVWVLLSSLKRAWRHETRHDPAAIRRPAFQ